MSHTARVSRCSWPAVFFSLVILLVTFCSGSFADDLAQRKVKSRVPPEYPRIARKLGLTGTVKLEVVIAPNGNVKETKVIGGHPILVTAAEDAVKKWKFEPASVESTGTVEVKFDPSTDY